jgi:hypothetical protein
MFLGGWMNGEVGGWVGLGGLVGGWVDGWMGGSKSRFKDCLQQSKMIFFNLFLNIIKIIVTPLDIVLCELIM